jgi:4-amino-4-deoxy-L-arabinose transferase-like glycosyltransferase
VIAAARRTEKADAVKRLLVLLAVFSLVAGALGYRLGEERIWRASEARCNAVVNEMFRSGAWLVPRIGPTEPPRLQKPPLFYWAATAAARLAGAPSVVTLRSVSVLAGLGLAVVVFLWGRSLGGFVCGIASTLSLVSVALFVVQSRYGDFESLLAFTSTLSLASFERLWQTRQARLLPVLAICVALAFLTKATAVLITIGVPICVWLALQRSFRLALRPLVLAWVAVLAAAALAWYVAILIFVPGAVNDLIGFAVEPIGAARMNASATHIRPWFYYLLRFPVQALPASLLLPWLIRDAVRTQLWRDDPRVRFIATSFVAIFAAWSLVPQKQMHYLLSITPLYALLCGVFVTRVTRRYRHGRSPADTRAGSSPRYSQ